MKLVRKHIFRNYVDTHKDIFFSQLVACLPISTKILRRFYHLTTQGLSRMFGFNQGRREPQIPSRLIHQQVEAFWQQTDQSRTSKPDHPNLLQEDEENTLIYGTNSREIINHLIQENIIIKQNLEKCFHDKIKQDQTIGEIENLLFAVNEICHSLVMELYKNVSDKKIDEK